MQETAQYLRGRSWGGRRDGEGRGGHRAALSCAGESAHSGPTLLA